MWTIGQLKERGKHCFRRNFWRTVLVALIVASIGGTQGGNAVRSIVLFACNLMGETAIATDAVHPAAIGSDRNADADSMWKENDPSQWSAGSYSFDDDDDVFEFNFGDDDFDFDDDDFGGFNPYGGEWDYGPNTPSRNDWWTRLQNGDTAALGMAMAFLSLIIVMMIILLILHILVDAFIRNPLFVGTQRFFIHNLKEPGMVADIGFGFDRQYKNQVRVMFLRDLYTIGWTLLFLFPGIYKSYEYRMVPYLMAEYPQMSKEQAFYTSKYLMKGDKGRAFLLDLSFLGWWILSGFTLGILGIFYVNPYYNTTCAALYEALKSIKGIPSYGQPQSNPYGQSAMNQGMSSMGQGGPGAQAGYGSNTAQPGYGNLNTQAGFGQSNRQTGYGSSDVQAGYGQGNRQPGYENSEAQQGYGQGNTQPGYGSSDMQAGYSQDSMQMGYGGSGAQNDAQMDLGASESQTSYGQVDSTMSYSGSEPPMEAGGQISYGDSDGQTVFGMTDAPQDEAAPAQDSDSSMIEDEKTEVPRVYEFDEGAANQSSAIQEDSFEADSATGQTDMFEAEPSAEQSDTFDESVSTDRREY
ncbi:MAG: DUF975 family protein [Lachnospiraceae bacterium]|nr:DUF975 family protein [Lachnospiraceae bacterium]